MRGSGSESGLSRNGTISLLCILLGREEEAVIEALKVSIAFSKEVCHLLCNQKGKLSLLSALSFDLRQ